VRHDLASYDYTVLAGAEEPIATMKADALAKAGATEHEAPEPIG